MPRPHSRFVPSQDVEEADRVMKVAARGKELQKVEEQVMVLENALDMATKERDECDARYQDIHDLVTATLDEINEVQ